jgi:subtilisin
MAPAHAQDGEVRVLASISDDGAKLVEASPATILALRARQPGLRIASLAYYSPAVAPRPMPKSQMRAAAAHVSPHSRLRVVSATDCTPVAGATVIAFTNFKSRDGVELTTDDQGQVSLPYPTETRFQRVYVFAKHGFWDAVKKNVDLKPNLEIRLRPLDLAFLDARRHFYSDADDSTGRGVRVAVLDTGVSQHPDLTIDGGVNTVPGEDAHDFGDSGNPIVPGHGTHVAGIIAGRGHPPSGMRGMAPGVSLRSYRVFAQGAEQADNYAIAAAVDAAVRDNCDLINMSLGGGAPDDVVRTAIHDARAAGTLVIVANGNDGRQGVSFPATDLSAIAVSALGRRGTYPSGAVDPDFEKAPFGSDAKNFVAGFSNVGPETDVIGPGVTIVSTVPGGYAPMSGTSMACPVVTGRAAQLLGERPDILSLNRDQERSDTMAALLFEKAHGLGFETGFEGHGLP